MWAMKYYTIQSENQIEPDPPIACYLKFPNILGFTKEVLPR